MPAVPVRTPEGDAAFFAALAHDHTVGAACHASGYTRSCVYRWRNSDPTFAAAWNSAWAAAADALEEEADRRLRGRYETPVHVKGVCVGYTQHCPDPLLYARFKALRRLVSSGRLPLSVGETPISSSAAPQRSRSLVPRRVRGARTRVLSRAKRIH